MTLAGKSEPCIYPHHVMDAYLTSEQCILNRNPPLAAHYSPNRMLINPLSPRLLKKAQMQGGAPIGSWLMAHGA